MNSSFAFDNSLNDEILTVQSQVNGIHLEHKVEQLDSPSHKGSYDNYFIESDLAQDTSNFWDYTSSDKIITELQPDEVRWFYKSYSNKRWIEFCGYDSLNIEAKYQQYFNGDWKYYISKTKANTGTSNGDAPDSPDSEREKYTVVVRGGLYEVELLEKQCVSIYWPG
ncbi:phospholipase DDHD1-like [Diaphorina citri]|nr:phospholipase DDHD1-like [Diaphorina citri]